VFLSEVKRKVRYYDYDYEGFSASEGVYGIHKFPAMLHYKIVESLIEEFSKENDLIYDPFCGSGVTLNVAIRRGRNAIGTDINPLAILIAEVRSFSYIDIESYLDYLLTNWETISPDIPSVRNINYWFKSYVIRDLGRLRTFLLNLPDSKEKKFFTVVFSQTVRDVSLTRKNEFKRYRMKIEDIEKFNPDVLKYFVELSKEYYERLRSSEKSTGLLRLYLHDVRYPMPFNEKVDLIITSPPYGDSKTTVAYGEFSSFSIEWLKGILPPTAYNLDRLSLGGSKKRKSGNFVHLPFLPTLERVLEKVAILDEKRATEVKVFYEDLFIALKNISSCLKDNGVVCFVVGNRRVKGILIPMDTIVKEMFEYLGLTHYETRIRKIMNKRMPPVNSPSNRKGDKVSTMREEFVVIMRS